MINEELYINGKLVDTGGDLGVRLNRKLIDPGALNTVDAQFSYSISLPLTQRNAEAFNYAHVEETRDKFNRVYTAEYIANGVRVFPPQNTVGLFRLTSIINGFKGQLYIPAKKTIKDIFGDLKLNQNAPYLLPFVDFAEYVNLYNNAAATEAQPAIFPYVMYGVLPKVPINRNANLYSARTLWDASVRLGIGDLAPAINPLIMLKHIFTSRGYELQGTAFNDEKLAKLYQTYKNAPDYVQPWNYGQHAKIKINGQWASTYNLRATGAGGSNPRAFERGINQGQDIGGVVYGVDLFDATNTKINITEDSGGNVLYKEINDGNGRDWVNCQVRIPTSGFYKVELSVQQVVFDVYAWRDTDPATGIQHVSGHTQNADNDYANRLYELRLVRDRGTGDFGVNSPKIDGVFYRNNQPQNATFDGNNIPKYFPQVNGAPQLNMIDLAQDRNHVLGFGWGRDEDRITEYENPRDGSGVICQLQAAKPSISWDTTESADNITRLAVKSRGFWKYGRIGTFDSEGDNPNVDLDYSGSPRVTGKVLDGNGNPDDPGLGNLDDRIGGYYLSILTGLQVPAAGWEVTDYLDLRVYLAMLFSGVIDNTGANLMAGVAYTTGSYITDTGAIGTTGDANVCVSDMIAVTPNADYVYTFTGFTYAVAFFDNLGNFLYTIGGDSSNPLGPFTTPFNAYSIRVNFYASELASRKLSLVGAASNVAIVAYYDANFQYIGQGVAAPPTGSTVTYTDEPIAPPSDAVYVRLAGQTASPLSITADSIADGNIILLRFQLARFYTYVITANDTAYNGVAYVHNGASEFPLLAVPFVNGVAEFSTAFAPLAVVDPKLTIYLKTQDFDVDGDLTISRRIENASADVIDWEITDKYAIDLQNAPVDRIGRGFSGDDLKSGDGKISAVVWFDAGELISLAAISTEGRYRQNGMHSTFGMTEQYASFDLSIQPFRVDPEWLKVDLRGNGTAAMNWNDPGNFATDTIDLVGFLSADMKTDEYIDNFTKAFNLGLSQIDSKTFSLDVKQNKTATSNVFIDLDKLASVAQRENTPLGLPSQYVLGFTIDPEEEGFVETGETGGGTFDTGASEQSVVTQTSAFSYNWYKAITKVEPGGNITINLPIISKAEVWDPTVSYPDAMKNRYTDLAQRFMYYGGILPGTFKFNGANLQIANVRNDMPGISILNYKNVLHTILYNYFTLLINGASHYTNIKGYLTAPQYVKLDGSLSVKFNGDMYFAAEITGYDPQARNQTTIKLIRKI